MPDKYADIFDYVIKEDKPFSERPFGNADSMVLSELSYLKMEKIVRKPSLLSLAMPFSALMISERLKLLLENVRDADKVEKLARAVASSRRFGSMKVNYAESRFSAEEENQFAAVTYFLDDGTAFAAFRGTDNTIVGWRENFNMAYKPFVPAQEDSVEYLEKVAVITHQPLRVGGHSKGGNLAVYAAANSKSKIQDRILGVYSLDGPGFKRAIFEDPEYLRIGAKVHRLMPTGTMIGTLLTQSDDYLVVESEGEGFGQHSLYNWRFDGDELVYADKLSDDAVRFDRMIDSWVGMLTNEQLEGTVNTVFGMIDEIEADSFDDVMEYLGSGELNALKAYRMIEPDKRGQAVNIVTALGKAFISSRLPVKQGMVVPSDNESK